MLSALKVVSVLLAASGSVLSVAVTSSQSPLSELLPGSGLLSSKCSGQEPQSCQAGTTQPDKCCYQSPGGIIVFSQFWEYQKKGGPAGNWTIHGLWPNTCQDGRLPDSGCDSSRDHKDLSMTELLGTYANDTLTFMREYWPDWVNDNDHFWGHEWSKHGTCVNTVNPSCLPEGSPKGTDAIAYFESAVRLYKTLNIYKWLEAKNIVPDQHKTYHLDAIRDALEEGSGGIRPGIYCKGGLHEVRFWFYLKGSAIDGEWIPFDSPQRDSGRCSPRRVPYYPKKHPSTS